MRLPWDPEQRMYVWFDALLNYVTALRFARDGEDLTDRYWPADLHVMAKDILKFHAVIWPALCLAAEIEPPRRMVIHGYLLMGEKKMSKSLGNVLDPFAVIDRSLGLRGYDYDRRFSSASVSKALLLAAELRRLHSEGLPLDFNEAMVRNGRIIAAEAYKVHRDYIDDPRLEIDPWVRKRVLSGKAITAAEYDEEIARQRRATAWFAEWMRNRDALLTPTLPITATPLDEVDESTTPLATWTRAANYLGACALSLPAGFSADGLPIGVQLTGAAFTEPVLVRLGRAFQRATDWHRRRPDL